MPAAPLTASDWPIAASTLPFPAVSRAGLDATHGGPDAWMPPLRELVRCGFTHVDLTDNWARIADLDASELELFAGALREAGIVAASSSLIRRSVIDDTDGDANLAYSHRALDACAGLGITTLSVGLHQALSDAQRQQLWFWTVEGHHDRPERWDDAVARLRELADHAASVGVVLSLELYEDTFLGDAATALRLLEDIGSDWVGINPDVANLIRLHRPVDSWRELFEAVLPHTNFWHVKNYTRDETAPTDAGTAGRFTAMPAHLDVGIINYRWAFEVAIESGFQGVICMENYGGDGLGVSAWNRDYLRNLVLPLTTAGAGSARAACGSPTSAHSVPQKRERAPHDHHLSRHGRLRLHGRRHRAGARERRAATCGIADVSAEVTLANLERIIREAEAFEAGGLFRERVGASGSARG